MDLFHVLDDTFVIIRSRGVFRQAKVYARGGQLYAGWGVGFVGLRGGGGTTKPDVSWEEISEHPSIKIGQGRFGAPLHAANNVRAIK